MHGAFCKSHFVEIFFFFACAQPDPVHGNQKELENEVSETETTPPPRFLFENTEFQNVARTEMPEERRAR